MAETELSVVCKSCGAEVSPYVTECPYCGTRIRKRAPKLERHGDELQARETRRARRRRRTAERRERASRLSFLDTERPYVAISAILAPAALLVVQRAADLSLFDLGVIVAGVGTTDWWQYFAAPFVYDDLGYLFAIALAMALFVPYLERRLGAVATLILLIACGALGALAAPGIDDALGDVTWTAGGNGIALGALGAWWVLRRADARDDPTEEYDWIPVAVAAAVLLLLPVVEDLANPWAGLVGGLVGLACGFSATLGRR